MFNVKMFSLMTAIVFTCQLALFAQSKSAIQFYDSTGAAKTGKVGWSGNATSGHFFIQTPVEGELIKSRPGGVDISGSVSATGFSGDGSGLTNLPSSSVTVGTVAGLQDSLRRKADTSWVTSKIAGIGTAQIPDDAVTTAKIADSAVTTAKIRNKSVTDAKIDSVTWAKVKSKPARYRTHSDSIAWTAGTDGQVWKMGAGGTPAWGADLQGTSGATTIGGITGLTDSLNAHRTLINGKANTSHTQAISTVTGLTDSLSAHRNLINSKANTASPTFTGDVTLGSGGGVVVNPAGGIDSDQIITIRNGIIYDECDLGIVTGKTDGTESGITFRAAGDASTSFYDFYALGSGTRSGDAIVRIHGKESDNFAHVMTMTHDGTQGLVSTGYGNLFLDPQSGIVQVDGTVNSSSDVRYKKNIKSIDSSLMKVKNLNGVSYEFRKTEFPDKHFPSGKQIGLIAQDVEKVIPEVISTDDKGYKSIAYDRLVAVLIEAVKSQQVEIDQLKNKVAKLSLP